MPRPKRTVGKPPETKFSPGRMKTVLSAIASGNYIKTACELAAVSVASYNNWRNRGEAELDRVEQAQGWDSADEYVMGQFDGLDDGARKDGVEYMLNHPLPQFNAREWPYVVFSLQIQRSQAAAEARALQYVRDAMSGTWQAAAWYLERVHPEKYGRRERINLEGSTPGSPVRISAGDLDTRLEELLHGKRR